MSMNSEFTTTMGDASSSSSSSSSRTDLDARNHQVHQMFRSLIHQHQTALDFLNRTLDEQTTNFQQLDLITTAPTTPRGAASEQPIMSRDESNRVRAVVHRAHQGLDLKMLELGNLVEEQTRTFRDSGFESPEHVALFETYRRNAEATRERGAALSRRCDAVTRRIDASDARLAAES